MWDDYWSMARYHLHLSEDEFWGMSPRQLSLLIDRYVEKVTRDHSMTALLATITANYSMCRPKEPYKIDDFMPQSMRSRKRESEADIARKIRATLAPLIVRPKS